MRAWLLGRVRSSWRFGRGLRTRLRARTRPFSSLDNADVGAGVGGESLLLASDACDKRGSCACFCGKHVPCVQWDQALYGCTHEVAGEHGQGKLNSAGSMVEVSGTYPCDELLFQDSHHEMYDPIRGEPASTVTVHCRHRISWR